MVAQVESGIRRYGGFPAGLEVSDVSSELETSMKAWDWCVRCGDPWENYDNNEPVQWVCSFCGYQP